MKTATIAIALTAVLLAAGCSQADKPGSSEQTSGIAPQTTVPGPQEEAPAAAPDDRFRQDTQGQDDEAKAAALLYRLAPIEAYYAVLQRTVASFQEMVPARFTNDNGVLIPDETIRTDYSKHADALEQLVETFQRQTKPDDGSEPFLQLFQETIRYTREIHPFYKEGLDAAKRLQLADERAPDQRLVRMIAQFQKQVAQWRKQIRSLDLPSVQAEDEQHSDPFLGRVQWGITTEDVKQAASGKLLEERSGSNETQLVYEVERQQLQLHMYYTFQDNRLVRAVVQRGGEQQDQDVSGIYAQLYDVLTETYGQPARPEALTKDGTFWSKAAGWSSWDTDIVLSANSMDMVSIVYESRLDKHTS